MKRVISFLVIFLLIFSFALATEAAPDNEVKNDNGSTTIFDAINNSNADETIRDAGETATNFGVQLLDQLAIWAAPFCALAIIWGAVCYFVLGIRNLYKKRQGMLLMWGSLTLFVVIVSIDFIINILIHVNI